uniref:Uncharacterized protein n=1 Tax=Timema cristinae TaxID=61476 RepID=A0A7R9DLV3_TIMCR|nr:unnamed protein product [Timema cristinae]
MQGLRKLFGREAQLRHSHLFNSVCTLKGGHYYIVSLLALVGWESERERGVMGPLALLGQNQEGQRGPNYSCFLIF